jgi:hypothetical protein
VKLKEPCSEAVKSKPGMIESYALDDAARFTGIGPTAHGF